MDVKKDDWPDGEEIAAKVKNMLYDVMDKHVWWQLAEEANDDIRSVIDNVAALIIEECKIPEHVYEEFAKELIKNAQSILANDIPAEMIFINREDKI